MGNFKIFLCVFSLAQVATAAMNIADVRGSEIKQYVSPMGLTEICVVPARLTGVNYSVSDLKREKKLCEFNFYAAENILCPKYNSTSAATILYSAESSTGKVDLQNASKCVALENNKVTTVATDKVAKFKQNEPLNDSTGTNIVSPLAYYHISRALGNILNVPVAVIRTMDIQSHLEVNKIFNDLSKIAKVSPGTKKGWDAFKSMHAGSRNNFKLYTNDQQQIYGAIIKGGGTAKAYDIDTQSTLSKTAYYQAHMSSRSILSILSGVHESAQRELTLQTSDVSDMIVIDTLLEQSDRYSGSNIETYNIYWDGVKYLTQKEADALTVTEIKAMKKIRRLSIQDNDAGMTTTKNTANWQRIDKMRHISPSTYKNVITLSQMPDLKGFLERETLMSDKESSRVIASLLKMSQKFQADCLSGRLMVDLDVEAVVNSTATLDFSKSQCL